MKRQLSVASLLVVALSLGTPAHASLVLNATGTSLGFTLSTFVGGFSGAYGPLAEGILPDGNVITGSLLNNKIYIFADTDGQTLSSALAAIPYTDQTGNPQYIITTDAGHVYGAQVQGGAFGQFANDGSFTPIPNLVAAGVTSYYGMWADPANGHLIASTSKGLVEIDPVAGTYRVINAGAFPDGVSVSPDGSTAYLEIGGAVQAYSIATGALLATYAVGHSPDGTGVITSSGLLNGDVIVNNNDGTVGLLDPTKASGDPTQYRIIATGGTRGDFVSPDTSNGTLFLSQEDQAARLSCGSGCSIGAPPPPGVPEPGTLVLLGGGFGVLAILRRRSSKSILL